MSDGRTPRFMSSTRSSRNQRRTLDPDSDFLVTPQPDSDIPNSKRKNFITSAGRRFVSLTTPRLRLENTPSIAPDNGSALPYLPGQDTAKPTKIPEPVKRRPSASPMNVDKPLPSLPVVSVQPRSPLQRRSLIDAIEQPLRTPNTNEDWPSLTPDKPVRVPSSGGPAAPAVRQTRTSLLRAETSKRAVKGGKASRKSKNDDAAYDQATIAEDDDGVRVKLISRENPFFGPRLRIARSADSLILGREPIPPPVPRKPRKARNVREEIYNREVSFFEFTSSSSGGEEETPQAQTAPNAAKSALSVRVEKWLNEADTENAPGFSVSGAPESVPGSTPEPARTGRPFDGSKISFSGNAQSKEKAAVEQPARERAERHASPASVYTLRGALNDFDPADQKAPLLRLPSSNLATNTSFPPRTDSLPGNARPLTRLNRTGERAGRDASSPPVTGQNTRLPFRSFKPQRAQHRAPAKNTTTNEPSKKTRSNPLSSPVTTITNKPSISSSRLASKKMNSNKNMMSGIRGLFHKHAEQQPRLPRSQSAQAGFMTESSADPEFSPAARLPALRHSSIRSFVQLRTNQTNATTTTRADESQDEPAQETLNTTAAANAGRANLPMSASAQFNQFQTPVPDGTELQEATGIAIRLLDLVRNEHDESKRSTLISLAKAIIATINITRDAEKATEEAKQAAAKAEIEFIKTKKNIGDMVAMMENFLQEL